jgi:amino acid permease
MWCGISALSETIVAALSDGCFIEYAVQYLDRALEFAVGWIWTIQWLTVPSVDVSANSSIEELWVPKREVFSLGNSAVHTLPDLCNSLCAVSG